MYYYYFYWIVFIWVVLAAETTTTTPPAQKEDDVTSDNVPLHCTSPVLFLTGFGEAEDQRYVVGKILDPAQDPSTARPDARTGDLAGTFFQENKARIEKQVGSVRAVAFFDYCLNATAELHLSLWFPCYDRPPKDIGFSMAPCVFQSMSMEEYERRQPSESFPGRKIRFYAHLDPNTTTEDRISMTCWLPPDEVATTKPMSRLDIANHGYRIEVQHVYQFDESSTFLCDPESDTCETTSNSRPAVWYGYTPVRSEPMQFAAKPIPEHDLMCRSVVTIRRQLPVAPPPPPITRSLKLNSPPEQETAASKMH